MDAITWKIFFFAILVALFVLSIGLMFYIVKKRGYKFGEHPVLNVIMVFPSVLYTLLVTKIVLSAEQTSFPINLISFSAAILFVISVIVALVFYIISFFQERRARYGCFQNADYRNNNRKKG
ncbi:MAG: hypothetical protein LBG82_08395 [Clostridiales Family XIII bacterium]|jgi:magnesium-transporting ATPase (P-type)|nr:hypothetical protein [Clostridiales Family XIII bacterium]